MTKQKTAATGAGKPEDPKKLRIVTTSAINAEVVDPKPADVQRGPMTGQASLADAEYLTTFASKQELAVFRASVEARRAKGQEQGWKVLPDGLRIPADNVLLICDKCRDACWLLEKHASNPCARCNGMGRKGGGFLRRAGAAEEKRWWEAERARVAKWVADTPKREAEERQLSNLRTKLGI